MTFTANMLKKHDAKLLFTDRDTLVYEIEIDDACEDFYKDKHLFDLIKYPKDLKFFDPGNEKVIGKMKYESGGKINDEFVGLKSKMYFIKDVDGEENKRTKGVNQNVVENTEQQDYIDVLFNKKTMRNKMKVIQIKLQRIGIYDVLQNFFVFF